jgi:hypothetical protein
MGETEHDWVTTSQGSMPRKCDKPPVAGRQLSKTLTALAGEFLVAGQLCLRGYVASLTLKNYPGVDIFALNPRTNKQVAIQVKATKVPRLRPSTPRPPSTYPRGTYFVPESVGEHPDQPFVFVAIGPGNEVEFFVVPGVSVAEISETERQAYLEYVRGEGRVVRDLQPRMISLESLAPFRDRWDLLGLED